MLILTRSINQSIRIDDDIHITVTRVKGENISLGIGAPPEVPIYREELLEKEDE